MPTHFTLTDPLDELRPIKESLTSRFPLSAPQLGLVWCSRELSLVLAYDHAQLQHCLYRLRPAAHSTSHAKSRLRRSPQRAHAA